jgi:hypothetical protein
LVSRLVLEWRGCESSSTDVDSWLMGSNIGGSTLHSWSGIGLGKFPVDKLTEMIKKNSIALDRWKTTGALIIDESESSILPNDATVTDNQYQWSTVCCLTRLNRLEEGCETRASPLAVYRSVLSEPWS